MKHADKLQPGQMSKVKGGDSRNPQTGKPITIKAKNVVS